MTPEDRLRQAVTHRTERVEPSADAFHQIEEKLMHVQQQDNRTPVLIGLGAAAAIAAVVVGSLILARDDGTPVATDGSTTTSQATTTTVAESTSTTAPFQTVDPALPMYPDPTTSQRFDDPVSVTRSFVVDFLGMIDPVVGAFQAGDARSGEVPVQPTFNGVVQPAYPVTTVLVRQLEDDTWFVLGAATDDIRLDAPMPGTRIACPVRLQGEALAFEGLVLVSVLANGVDEPIGTGTVQGGGGPAAPFDGTVECNLDLLDDGVHYGSIILSTTGGEDDRVWQFTAVRVALK
jgi:hypothetical protein